MAEEISAESTGTVSKEAPNMLNGREVKNIKIRCSKHGDISQGSFYLRYTTIREGDRTTVVNNNNLMCMCCLNDLYMKLQETPKTEKIVSYKRDENGKLLFDENGDPIQIVDRKIVYLRDKEGKLILDKDGNPVPEMEVGKISVEVAYEDDGDKPKEIEKE